MNKKLAKKLGLMLLASLLSSIALAFELKGVKVDQPVDCNYVASLEVRQGKYAPSCLNGVAMWMTEVSFLDANASLLIQQSVNKDVVSVQVRNFNFQSALDALTVKYGSPKTIKSIIQNKAGATFEQFEAEWREGAQILHISKHGSKIGEPIIFLSGKLFLDAQPVRAEKALSGSKNL